MSRIDAFSEARPRHRRRLPWPAQDWIVVAHAPMIHGRRDGVLRLTGISPPDYNACRKP